MAEDDVPEYDENYSVEWFYVEDEFSLPDELVETQIPDPGYAGTNLEIEMESADWDVFDYWDDLEYGDDEYWDYGTVPGLKTGHKRKRNSDKTAQHQNKRRKLALKETEGSNVKFMSVVEQLERARRKPQLLEKRASFALLPDWKKRFADDSEVLSEKEMPADMKMAAEATVEDTPPKRGHVNLGEATAEDEEWEDEEEEGDIQAQLASLDPEMLKAILKQKLGDAGLEGMDEGAFMQTISKMLAGDEGAEDAAGDLANSLLGQATEGNDAALSGWLSQQGVSIDAADEDDASSVATAELPEGAGKPLAKGLQASPPDSAIEMSKSVNGTTSELAIHGSSPTGTSKKRTAPVEAVEAGSEKKRKRVTFDVPSLSNLGETATANEETAKQEYDATEAPGIEVPPTVEPIIPDEKQRTTKTKVMNASAAKSNKAKPPTFAAATASTRSKAKSTKEVTTVEDVKPATRKRKAGADDDIDDVENKAPTHKKRAAAANVDTGGRKTRSTRAGSGKGK